MCDNHRVNGNEVNGSVITAISMQDYQVTVTSESRQSRLCIVCADARIISGSIDCISLLRLNSPDRRIVHHYMVRVVDVETLLFLVLACGAYLTIRASGIALKSCPQTN
jgi:hypothetical protein